MHSTYTVILKSILVLLPGHIQYEQFKQRPQVWPLRWEIYIAKILPELS